MAGLERRRRTSPKNLQSTQSWANLDAHAVATDHELTNRCDGTNGAFNAVGTDGAGGRTNGVHGAGRQVLRHATAKRQAATGVEADDQRLGWVDGADEVADHVFER